MKMQEIFSALCEYAPLELSNAFVLAEDGYDNSGIIVETDREIKKILFALDLSVACAERAVNGGFDLVVTHHPAIYYPIKSLDFARNRALTLCATRGVGVISMHLNLDIAERGIDYYMAQGLGATEQKILTPVLGDFGYGRAFEISPVTLADFKSYIQKTFDTDNVMIFGQRDRQIKRVASFCGAGCGGKELEIAAENGADAVVSADFKHNVIKDALDCGVCVVQMTHYACENYGMKFFAKAAAEKLSGVSAEYFDEQTY